MSQLHHGFPASAGEPDPSSKLSWQEFVQIVLKLTITAYQAMNRDRVAKWDWEEDQFSINLGEEYLRPIAFLSSIFVQVRPKKHTDAMREGKQSAKEAKEIDIKLFGSWELNYHQKHFVWEAKLVGDKRLDPRYKDLHTEYIHEAIYRFIKKNYAAGLKDAGVLGYVMGGEIATIVRDINVSMSTITKNPPLPEANHLHLTEPINNFEHVYQSRHTRTDETPINLYHLFLPFDFV